MVQQSSAPDDPRQLCVLGMDAGGTFFKYCLVRRSGAIVDNSAGSLRVDTQGDADTILSGYAKVVSEARRHARSQGLLLAAAGVSTPGPFDYRNCKSLMTHKMRSIYGVDIAQETALRVPGAPPMVFMHDSHAFLLGEYAYGAARGFRNAAAVTIGTGTGFAVIEDGVLRTSETMGPYISIYRRSFRDATVEQYISRGGILRLYSELSGRAPGGGFDVADIARLAIAEGDRHALETFRQTGALLAEAIVTILTEQRTECLVLGGQISKSFSLMEQTLREGLARVSTLCKIAPAQHIDTSAQLGAAAEALRLLRTRSAYAFNPM